jgi:hypothetical protein
VDSDPEQREARIHQLGNLTLTSGPLNSSLSNGPWHAKRPALLQHSLLALNQQLGPQENWDEDSIKRRGGELAQQICGLWLGPEAPSWPGVYESLSINDATTASSDPLATSDSSSAHSSPTRMTRYHVIVDGHELPHENKRKTMLVMVTNLIERGVSACDIEDELGSRFRSVDGEHDDPTQAFLDNFQKLYGRKFDPVWWYTDHPFHQDGRTWLLDKGWGTNTEPALTALCERFPEVGMTFRRADA